MSIFNKTSIKHILLDRFALHAAFLTITCIIVYASSLTHDFIPFHDDNTYIIFNKSITGLSFENIRLAFTNLYAGNYAPIQIVSYMLNYSTAGLNPAGFILVNIILHIANGLLLQQFLVQSNFSQLNATASASLFLLHPVQVEAVIWASERKTVLAMLFFLLAMHSYKKYRDQRVSPWYRIHYCVSLLFFILAVLSKSVTVILPAVLIIHDFAYRKNVRRWDWLPDKIPYILIGLAGVAATIYTQAPEQFGGRTGFHGGSALTTFYTMLPVLLKYLRLVFWPTDLSIYYGSIQIKASFDEDVFLGGLVSITLLALGILLWRKNRQLFCWFSLFFVGLLPVSQIIPIVTLINDRYLYFPLIGGTPFLIGSTKLLLAKLPRYKLITPVLAITLILSLSILTYQQTNTWQNTLSLYRQVINTNHEQIDLKFLEDTYFINSELDGLLEVSQTLLNNFPLAPEVHKFVSIVYNRKNEPLMAQQHLERGVQLNPRDLSMLYMLADSYQKTGNTRAVHDVYSAILAIDPDSDRAKKAYRAK